MKTTFRSLAIRDFRLWILGLFVSSVGSWMQMTGQDWVVLTELTDHDATALGVVVALQFIPQLILSPIAGVLVDRFDRRRLLLGAQTVQLVLALILGMLILMHIAKLWHVFVLAFLLGCVGAVDGPARQTFVHELVPGASLANGIALSSAAFNFGRLVGPAIAGVAIASVGSGSVFLLNAGSFLGVIVAILAIKRRNLTNAHPIRHEGRGLTTGFAYLWRKKPTLIVMAAVFLVNCFGLNSAIFAATMASSELHAGPDGFGILTSSIGFGAMIGSLATAALPRPSYGVMIAGTAGVAATCIGAAWMPTLWLFAALCSLIGAGLMIVVTTVNTFVQLNTAPKYRGRVTGTYMAIFMAGGPVGGPVFGFLTHTVGPRGSLVLAGAAMAVATVLFVVACFMHRRLSDSALPAVEAFVLESEHH
ncbi:MULTISPECIES: MFS transporter [unclassified Arthrobacter]|uniref:MFS transporter n=1 Tax=unclassified Arthrobacter TaxID=235627 RepID=UPI001C85F9F4|nr:MFS transporter [Arthrobacter sp. MAHUQ-56]MBX7445912.1 MFS transporter [Arthrobacter sp. MAHUQ-56]